VKIGVDADVVVHLIATPSERHAVTMASFQEYCRAGAEIVLAENVLLEAFSVLSRSPKPIGIRAEDAARALRESFGATTIAPIRSGLALRAIAQVVDRGFAGGRVYDAAIAIATYEAGARLLLTWNVKNFLTVAPVGLEIRQP